MGAGAINSPYPFVSSAVETPVGHAQLHGISNPERVEGLDANGLWVLALVPLAR